MRSSWTPRRITKNGAILWTEFLSTGSDTALLALHNLGIPGGMSGARIDQAIARIEAALARIETSNPTGTPNSAENSARVTALVNSHEQLREEVAETLRELDGVIGELSS